jgi:hypothetical protein
MFWAEISLSFFGLDSMETTGVDSFYCYGITLKQTENYVASASDCVEKVSVPHSVLSH